MLAAVPLGSAATEHLAWTEQGGDSHRNHLVTSPYANPDTLAMLADVDVGARGSASSPLAIDLDGDGDLELVTASEFWDDYGLTYVQAYDYDGTNLVQLWRTQLDFSETGTEAAVRLGSADLNGNGTPEIVAYQAFKNDGGPGGAFMGTLILEVLDTSGNILATTAFGGFEPTGRLPHPAIGDLDGDGTPEIVIGTNNMRLMGFVYDSGAINNVWVQDLGAGQAIEFAIGEVDPNHNGMEVVVARDTSSTAGALWTCRPTATAANCTAGPASAHGPHGVNLYDVDGDGDLDALTGGRSRNGDNGHNIYKNDGNGTFTFFAGRNEGYTANTPAAGDVNRDGQLDFVIGHDHNFIDQTDGGGHIFSSTFDGTTVSNLGTISLPAIMGAPDQNLNWYNGVLGNVIGDENLEFISMGEFGDAVIVTYNETAAPALNQTIVGPSLARAAPILADINSDCALDIILTYTNGVIRVYGDDTPRFVPSAPQNLTGTETGVNATLTWDAPASDGGREVLEYVIYRAARGGAFSEIARVNGTTLTYLDATGPPFAAEVDYRVEAINCMGTSPASNKVQLDVHEPPFQVNNTGLDLPPAADILLNASELSFADDLSSADGITFTLEALPVNGTLTLAGAPLGDGAAWTMQDLLDDALGYNQAGACPALVDKFTFNVTDHHGKWSGPTTFELRAPTPPPLRTTVRADATVLEGSSVALNATHLAATDPCVAAETLQFEITQIPTLGVLYLAGNVANIGDTLSQADWAAGDVVFTSTGGTTGQQLGVQISNGQGDLLDVIIGIAIEAATPPTASFSSPSAPYYGGLELRFIDQSYPGSHPIDSILWEVLDANGNIVYTSTDGTMFFVPSLGTYTVRLTASDGLVHSHSTTQELIVDRVYEPAIPEFLMSNAEPVVGEPVTFWDTSKKGSFALEGREWNFQDPHPPTQDASVLHIFEKTGTYLVSLKIKDAKGFEYFATHELTVHEATEEVVYPSLLDELANQPRGMALADAGPDQVVLGGTIVQLDAGLSRPGPGGDTLRYTWTHVGGMHVPVHGADTSTPRVSLPYITADESEVLLQLVVTDNLGQVSAPDIVRLLVRSEGVPSLKPVPAPTGDFAFVASPTGNVTLVAHDQPGTGVTYTWDFGDGTTNTTTASEVGHRYASAGVYQVRLRVEDSFGRVAEYQRAVELLDPAASEDADIQEAPPRPPSQSNGGGGYVLLMILAVAVCLGAIGFVGYTVLRSRSQKA